MKSLWVPASASLCSRKARAVGANSKNVLPQFAPAIVTRGGLQHTAIGGQKAVTKEGVKPLMRQGNAANMDWNGTRFRLVVLAVIELRSVCLADGIFGLCYAIYKAASCAQHNRQPNSCTTVKYAEVPRRRDRLRVTRAPLRFHHGKKSFASTITSSLCSHIFSLSFTDVHLNDTGARFYRRRGGGSSRHRVGDGEYEVL